MFFISRDVVIDETVMRNLIKYDVKDADKTEMFSAELEQGRITQVLPDQASDSEEEELNEL